MPTGNAKIGTQLDTALASGIQVRRFRRSALGADDFPFAIGLVAQVDHPRRVHACFRRSAGLVAFADGFEPVVQVQVFAAERDELLANALTFGPVFENAVDREPLFRSIKDSGAFHRRKSLLMLVCRTKSMIWRWQVRHRTPSPRIISQQSRRMGIWSHHLRRFGISQPTTG